jgi:hypothetical protein
MAERRPVTSGHETARGEAHEHRRSKVNEMCAQRKEKGERRIDVHSVVFSGEVGWDFGEQFPRRESLPREAETSTGCERETELGARRRGWR